MQCKRVKIDHTTTGSSGEGVAGPSAPRAPRGAVRGRRGGLKDMPNMPIDILLEVRAMYISPELVVSSLSYRYLATLILEIYSTWQGPRRHSGRS